MKYVVTDDAVEIAEQTRCLVLQEGMPSNAYQCTKRLKAMRAALESFAKTLGEPVAVPDAIAGPGVVMSKQDVRDAYYAEGWNACREAMLSAAPHHPTTEKGCE